MTNDEKELMQDLITQASDKVELLQKAIIEKSFEIERLKAEVKQAKIDVLNELRTYCFECEDYHGARQQQIEQLLRLDEEKKMRPSFGENEKRELKNSADKANGQSTMANKVVEKIDDLLKEVEND